MIYDLLLKLGCRLWSKRRPLPPEVFKKEALLFWIHAVSVGETLAVVSLAKQLSQQFPQAEFVVTSITNTGYAEAKRSLPFAAHHFLFPLDTRKNVRQMIDRLRPDLVLVVETDYWWNFLREARKIGAKIFLVNGKASTRTSRFYSWLKPLSRSLFSNFDHFHVQNHLYAKRFQKMGVPKERLTVTGNMKLDCAKVQMDESALRHWRDLLGLRHGERVIVVGSTHEPEEKNILEQLKDVEAKIFVVPRHPERFEVVARELKLPKFSDGPSPERVVLVDAMGVLKKFYQVADLAIVAGSFTKKVGGHNILEPCEYGVPVLFGPYMKTQPELQQLCKEYGAGEQTTITNLRQHVENMLALPEAYREGGLRLIRESSGATNRTCTKIIEALR